MTANNDSQRLYWIDVLRLVAMLMVIAAHCVDIYNATPQDDPMNSFWGAFIGSLMRPSVPLFAMIYITITHSLFYDILLLEDDINCGNHFSVTNDFNSN